MLEYHVQFVEMCSKFPLSEAAETLFDYGNGKDFLHSITFCEAKYDRNGVVPIDLISER